MVRKKIEELDKRFSNSSLFQKIDFALRTWMKENGFNLLRYSIGFIFLWFGILKFFPGTSPAEEMVTGTINQITFGVFSESQINAGLAIWETLIGLGLILGIFMRLTLLLLFLQLPGTFLPVFLFPEQVFEWIPLIPTLKGQYIFKNLVLIAAAIILGGQVGNKPSDGLKTKSKNGLETG
jgi:uncharacterized membrane protein YkgB